MSDAFKKYNVDSALKKANYDVTKMQQVDAIKILDILQKAFGYRGFYTCDTGYVAFLFFTFFGLFIMFRYV